MPDLTDPYETEVVAAREADVTAEIANFVKELEPAPADPPADPPKAEAPPAPAPADPPAPKEDDPATARGLLRLLERETEISNREKALEARAKELEASNAAGITREDVLAALDSDPLKFFEAVGIAPEEVSRRIIAAKLGDKAPAELREASRDYKFRRELDALKQTIKDRDEALSAKEKAAARESAAREYVNTGVSEYPALAAAAAKNRDRVTSAIVREMAAGGTAKEAAARVEAEWAFFREVYAPAQAAPPPPASTTPPPAATAPQGSQTQNTPPRPPPRRPWHTQSDADREVEVEAAIREAEAIARRGMA